MQEEQKRQNLQQQQQTPQQPVSGNSGEPPEDNKDNVDNVYDIEGLLAGGAAGLVVGILIKFETIFAIQIGMFVGLLIGTRFKKNKNK
ncbi:MAG: hypothetical protein FWG57_02460 [Endomicrobia bacterium]|nr:hypothetical protein [Endomicrobiia bacterium]